MTLEHALRDPNILSLICGGGAFAVVVLIWMALIEGDPVPDRLRSISDRRAELSHEERSKKESRRENLVGGGIVQRLVHKMKLEQGRQTNEIRLKLARAGIRSHEALLMYLLLRVLLPIGFGIVAFFFLFVLEAYRMQMLMKVVAVFASVLLGVAAPDIFLKNQSQKRQDILRKAMPDGLDLMVICAEAGLSLDASLDRVSREMAPSCAELSEEIGLTAVELGFFPERSQALRNLSDRVPIPGVVGLVNTLIQTEKYGTPLAQALRVLSSEMRSDRIMAAETKAAKLPATLTVPMILFILPPLFVVLLGPAILQVQAMSH